ncbi:hypothetical protein C8D86_11117 [Aquicella lusitana]|uniref:AhpC/TSA family protein n=1 Tax=Aquicella lusitana TaxID=254246 RepID=A0A370GI87_9COXI|nr:hypothetical protein C8D86_11117 [Aquicella lusitana]
MAKYYKNTLLIALLSAGVLLFYYTFSQRHHVPRYPAGLHGVYLSLPASPPVFHLTDHTGKPFTSTNLKGHWTLVFFWIFSLRDGVSRDPGCIERNV